MELIVDDTNILIDLANIGLAPFCRDMDLTFLTTDFVIHELRDSRQFEIIRPLIEEGKLVEKHFEGKDVIELTMLYQECHRTSNLTPADCSVMLLAQKERCRLLTNDQKLLRIARSRGITTNGLLWLTDLMVNDGVVLPMTMANSLQELLRTNMSAPREQIMERIEKYIRDINNFKNPLNDIEL